jgi:hypothetical protein
MMVVTVVDLTLIQNIAHYVNAWGQYLLPQQLHYLEVLVMQHGMDW